MSKNKIILIIGIILLLIPSLGFPARWEDFFFRGFGLSLVALSFSHSIKRRTAVAKKSSRAKKESQSSVFVDGHGSYIAEESNTPKELDSSVEISSTEDSQG